MFQVQEAVKCRVVDRKDDGNGDSGSSLQNGHTQLVVSVHASILTNLHANDGFYKSYFSSLFFLQSDFEKDADANRPGEDINSSHYHSAGVSKPVPGEFSSKTN